MKYVFMINPAAGRGKKYNKLIDDIKSYFAVHPGCYEIVVSEKKGDILKKSKQFAESGEEHTIFACGGEGTCFEVLNGIAGYGNITVGVIPIGSANDFLKYFGNENKSLFLDLGEQLGGKNIYIDSVKADEYYCINGCSAGMDAIVARDMTIFKHLPLVSGPAAYKLAIVKTFLGKIGVNIELTIDGKKQPKKNCLFAFVGNGPVYGGGYMAAPKACPFDGVLDYAVVDTINRFKVLPFLKDYEKGDYDSYKFCSTGRCKTLSFRADKPIPVNLDGEIFERKKMTFSIVKDMFSFRLPLSLAEKYAKNVNVL